MNRVTVAIGATLIGGAVIASAALVSRFNLRMAQEKTISVKGFAKSAVSSDVGTFDCKVSSRHTDRASAMQVLGQHRQSVLSYLKKAGVSDTEIELHVPRLAAVNQRDKNGRTTNVTEFHDATQVIRVTSDDVARVSVVSKDVAGLAADGVFVTVGSPKYLIRDAADLKLKLIAGATEDASARAGLLATRGGGSIGALRAARQGVFQITEPNSTETSSYGTYDTSTIEKEIKAVVTLEYEVTE